MFLWLTWKLLALSYVTSGEGGPFELGVEDGAQEPISRTVEG